MNIFKRKSRKPPESNREKMQRRLVAAEILSVLNENGFVRCKKLETKYGDNSEIVYAKPLKSNKRKMVVVYTSCNQVGGAFTLKKKGKDAIRIAGLMIDEDGKTVGIVKNKRVNRSGETAGICKRMTERIVKTYMELKNNNEEHCKECGSIKFISKKGNYVCSKFCWSK
jgi:hypothetical protein